MQQPLIIAHRGASTEFLENTLPAFRRAVQLGVDAIELDARVTRDGVAVVFHDDNLRRLAGRRGRVEDLSWAEVRAVRLRGNASIPRLVEVLRLTRGKLVVQIEVKSPTPLPPVLRAVRAARAAEWVVLASFSPAVVRAAAERAPTIPRMLISEGRGSPTAIARQLAACRAGGLSVNFRAVQSAAWVRHFRARGWLVWAWTVNAAPTARRLARWGVEGVMGDNPALLGRVL